MEMNLAGQEVSAGGSSWEALHHAYGEGVHGNIIKNLKASLSPMQGRILTGPMWPKCI